MCTNAHRPAHWMSLFSTMVSWPLHFLFFSWCFLLAALKQLVAADSGTLRSASVVQCYNDAVQSTVLVGVSEVELWQVAGALLSAVVVVCLWRRWSSDWIFFSGFGSTQQVKWCHMKDGPTMHQKIFSKWSKVIGIRWFNCTPADGQISKGRVTKEANRKRKGTSSYMQIHVEVSLKLSRSVSES